MEKIINILNTSLSVFYLILFLVYAKSFFSKPVADKKNLVYALPAILSLHFIKLAAQGLYYQRCPLVGFDETLSFTAFMVGATYFIIERRQKYFATGGVFIGIVSLLQLGSLFFAHSTGKSAAEINNIPIGFHAPVALLGIAFLTASAVYGGIYLILLRLLKTKKFSNLDNIPPLETIEKIQSLSSMLGVIIFGLALLAGILLWFIYRHGIPVFDPKILVSFLAFIMFAYGAIGSRFYAFSGRKKSAIAIIGMIFAFVSMTIIRFYFTTFHRF